LEASVRALENHAIVATNSGREDLFSIWHDNSPNDRNERNSSLVSSSFSSVLSVGPPSSGETTNCCGERSLPRRHHTIGNIRYDSSAYKTVSFQEDEPKSGGAGMFRHMKQKTEDQEEDSQQTDEVHEEPSCSKVVFDENVEVRLSNNENKRNDRHSSSSLSEQQRSEEQDDVVTNLIDDDQETKKGPKGIINISRSKSFSDVTLAKNQNVWRENSNDRKTDDSPALRSKSFKDISSKKTNRLSWDADIGSLGSPGSLRDLPSHLRGSLASLTSLDLHSSSSISTEVSSKELASKPGTLCGHLEIKSRSGFKTYKRYWCSLDGANFYIFARDKDTKAKQAIHLAGYKVKAVKVVESGGGLGGSFRSEVKKKGRQFELIPPAGAKDTRQFAANTKEEADIWVRRLQEAIDSLSAISSPEDHSIEALSNGCKVVDPIEVTTNDDFSNECVALDKDHLYFWHQTSFDKDNESLYRQQDNGEKSSTIIDAVNLSR
jgi:hypothetical protein